MCSHIQKVNTRGCPQNATNRKPRRAHVEQSAGARSLWPPAPFLPGGPPSWGLWEGSCPTCRPGGHRDPPAHLGSGFVWWFEKRWVGRTWNADYHIKARGSPHRGPAYETETGAIHERGECTQICGKCASTVQFILASKSRSHSGLRPGDPARQAVWGGGPAPHEVQGPEVTDLSQLHCCGLKENTGHLCLQAWGS